MKRFSQRTTFIFLFLLFSGFKQTHAQTHSFIGTIGKYPIYMEFTVDGNKVDGTYFYKSKLVDISFLGTYKAGVIVAKTTDAFGEVVDFPETFKFKWLNTNPTGTWSHLQKSSELKLFPLTVKETGSAKWANPYFNKEYSLSGDLTKVKVGLFKLKEDGPPQLIGKVKIREFTEVTTGITYFRIDSGLVADKQKDANFYLEFLQLSEFLAALECASYSNYASDYGFSISNITISNDFMCFSAWTTFYCGGAHPDESNYGINFDLNAHQIIDSEDYLRENKSELFQQRVIGYLSAQKPGYFDPESESDVDDMAFDCNYYMPELWTSDCSFTFTGDGLKLHPSFAHYMAPCMDPEWSVIPYSELKDLIKPEYYSKLVKLKP